MSFAYETQSKILLIITVLTINNINIVLHIILSNNRNN